MEYILSGAQMRECDRKTIEETGIPSLVLMERAASEVVRALKEEKFDLSHVLVVCGAGNNGGDGMAAARMLAERRIPVTCVLAGPWEKCSEQTKVQLGILKNLGLKVDNKIPEAEYTTIIDALFGIGLKRPVEGVYKELIGWINSRRAKVLSVDIPSGIHTDSAAVMGDAVRADVTVTFAYKKLGCILYPGAEYAGKLLCVPIGITERAFDEESSVTGYRESAGVALPVRKPYSNKGSYGKALLAAGSKNMAGAAVLGGMSALRSGAGMVRICTPEENRIILQQTIPEALLSTYSAEAPDPEELSRDFRWATAAGIGPGLSESGAACAVMEALLAFLREEGRQGKRIPLVVDADGLNILAGRAERLKDTGQSVIVTPHLGEMARLTGKTIGQIRENLPDTAAAFSKEYGVVCVLKDARTVIAEPSGRLHLNQNGNSGMATAGSGDVLSGIILGLLAQGETSYEAARKGVYLHGEAGDLAAKEKGEYGMTAQDIAKALPVVLKRHSGRQRENA